MNLSMHVFMHVVDDGFPLKELDEHANGRELWIWKEKKVRLRTKHPEEQDCPIQQSIELGSASETTDLYTVYFSIGKAGTGVNLDSVLLRKAFCDLIE